jgi:putative acetyltransferase
MASTCPDSSGNWRISREDPGTPDVLALLEEHAACMQANSPPGSCHYLAADRLCGPNVGFWTIRRDGLLAGCGALLQIEPCHAEIKSMKTAGCFLRQGVAKSMLQHLLASARDQGMARLSLETGSGDYFVPARRMYENAGFTYCCPFASNEPDTHSMFMTMALDS